MKRVNLFAHGNPGLIGLRGRIAPKDHAVYFGDAGPDDRPEVLMAEVDLGASWAIDDLAISWINSCARGLALRERIRRVFCQRAELWLIVCHGAGGLSGIDAGAGSNLSRARGIDAGAGSNLSRALASTFQVTVRSYAQSVWYWPDPDDRQSRILSQDMTSVGKGGERHRGYYCAENIVDPDTNEHVGAHMRKAASSPTTSTPVRPSPGTSARSVQVGWLWHGLLQAGDEVLDEAGSDGQRGTRGATGCLAARLGIGHARRELGDGGGVGFLQIVERLGAPLGFGSARVETTQLRYVHARPFLRRVQHVGVDGIGSARCDSQ